MVMTLESAHRNITGTAFSHYSYVAIEQHGEQPRWPASELIRGKIHIGVPSEEKGMLKTHPKKHKWWANVKTQPARIPVDNRRSRGVHASTWVCPVDPFLNPVDPSGRKRYVLQDAESIDVRLDSQEGYDVSLRLREPQVPLVVVTKAVWEDWEMEGVVWKDGERRWGRGLSLMDELSGEKFLLMKWLVRLKGISRPKVSCCDHT